MKSTFSTIQVPFKYEKTSNRSWSVSARLVSRTQGEASLNQYYLNVIRGWLMPYYGSGTESLASDKLGAPPPVLKFSGYGPRNISPIPVVLESYDTSWPNDVDYIPTYDGTPFPVIMEINLNLKEAFSPGEFSKFDLYAYKTGDLSTAYGGTAPEAKKPGGSTANAITDTSSPVSIGNMPAISGVPSIDALSKGALNIPNPTSGFSLAGATSNLKSMLSNGLSGLPKGDAEASLKAWQESNYRV